MLRMRPFAMAPLVALVLGLVPATASAQLRASVVASGLTNPVAFVADPADPATCFIVEQPFSDHNGEHLAFGC